MIWVNLAGENRAAGSASQRGDTARRGRNQTPEPPDSTQRTPRFSQRSQRKLCSAFLCANLGVLCVEQHSQSCAMLGDSRRLRDARRQNRRGPPADTSQEFGQTPRASATSASLRSVKPGLRSRTLPSQRVSGSTRLWRVVFGVTPKTLSHNNPCPGKFG